MSVTPQIRTESEQLKLAEARVRIVLQRLEEENRLLTYCRENGITGKAAA